MLTQKKIGHALEMIWYPNHENDSIGKPLAS